MSHEEGGILDVKLSFVRKISSTSFLTLLVKAWKMAFEERCGRRSHPNLKKLSNNNSSLRTYNVQLSNLRESVDEHEHS